MVWSAHRPGGAIMRAAAGFLVTVLALAGCAQPPAAPAAAPADVAVTRDADGGLTVRWSAAGPVDVYVAPAPDLAGRTLISDDNADGLAQVSRQPARVYLHLVAEGATQGVWAAERVLPLEGGRNFRDLGGYPAAEGRSVRWGMLYRSGVMADLTPTDYQYLDGLGIKTVCDFRSTEERANEPTQWAARAIDYRFRDYDDASSSVLRAALTAPDLTAAKVSVTMATLYGGMLDRFSGHYADMFEQLLAGKAPLAFNCSAGKDRTGIAAALVLSALGVPRDAILADYALSDDIVNYEAAYTGPDAQRSAEGPYGFLTRLPAAVRAPLLASDPAYLNAAFAEMERRHGSVEGYLEAALGVDAADIATLRSLYLE
jgi:protein-tyrosine phosphatase